MSQIKINLCRFIYQNISGETAPTSNQREVLPQASQSTQEQLSDLTQEIGEKALLDFSNTIENFSNLGRDFESSPFKIEIISFGMEQLQMAALYAEEHGVDPKKIKELYERAANRAKELLKISLKKQTELLLLEGGVAVSARVAEQISRLNSIGSLFDRTIVLLTSLGSAPADITDEESKFYSSLGVLIENCLSRQLELIQTYSEAKNHPLQISELAHMAKTHRQTVYAARNKKLHIDEKKVDEAEKNFLKMAQKLALGLAEKETDLMEDQMENSQNPPGREEIRIIRNNFNRIIGEARNVFADESEIQEQQGEFLLLVRQALITAAQKLKDKLDYENEEYENKPLTILEIQRRVEEFRRTVADGKEAGVDNNMIRKVSTEFFQTARSMLRKCAGIMMTDLQHIKDHFDVNPSSPEEIQDRLRSLRQIIYTARGKEIHTASDLSKLANFFLEFMTLSLYDSSNDFDEMEEHYKKLAGKILIKAAELELNNFEYAAANFERAPLTMDDINKHKKSFSIIIAEAANADVDLELAGEFRLRYEKARRTSLGLLAERQIAIVQRAIETSKVDPSSPIKISEEMDAARNVWAEARFAGVEKEDMDALDKKFEILVTQYNAL